MKNKLSYIELLCQVLKLNKVIKKKNKTIALLSTSFAKCYKELQRYKELDRQK